MDEVEKAVQGSTTQDTNNPEKESHMTFDEVKDLAWQRSQETLVQWRDRLQNKVKEKSSGINKHLKDLSTLYGESVPERVAVSLQFYPREDSQEGEPINNFTESGRLEADIADVLYWVSNPGVLLTDAPEDTEAIYDDAADGAVQRILHEVQHSNLQKEAFKKLIEESEKNPEVQAVLAKLEGVSGEYIEVTNELVTTYLESLGKKRLDDARGGGGETPLVIEVDEDKHGKVLEAVIREDVEGWRDKGRGSGPYTDLRQCWERELGRLPVGYQTKDNEKNVAAKDADRTYMGVRVYELARELDTSLAEKYVQEGKPMDEEFIVELYRMVSSKLEK